MADWFFSIFLLIAQVSLSAKGMSAHHLRNLSGRDRNRDVFIDSSYFYALASEGSGQPPSPHQSVVDVLPSHWVSVGCSHISLENDLSWLASRVCCFYHRLFGCSYVPPASGYWRIGALRLTGFLLPCIRASIGMYLDLEGWDIWILPSWLLISARPFQSRPKFGYLHKQDFWWDLYVWAHALLHLSPIDN